MYDTKRMRRSFQSFAAVLLCSGLLAACSNTEAVSFPTVLRVARTIPSDSGAEYDDYERMGALVDGLVKQLRSVDSSIQIQTAKQLSKKRGMKVDLRVGRFDEDKGFVNFKDPIPLYISGFGPKSLALAGKYGDGAVLGVNTPETVSGMWHLIQEGAKEINRDLKPKENYYTTALTSMVVLEEGEAVDSDRVKSECGAMAMAAVHYNYDQYRNFGHQPPNAFTEIWEDYTSLLESFPEEKRHQRIHEGHNCWVIPEEEKFLTPKVLTASNMIGTKEELLERLNQLSESGLDQVMILPNFDTRYEVIEKVAKDIIPNL